MTQKGVAVTPEKTNLLLKFIFQKRNKLLVLPHAHVLLGAGGGAVEAALSIYLENFATTLGSREQLAIAEFADALLAIPKTLAVNAAQVKQAPSLL